MALMDSQYLKAPFYGSRRMAAWLRDQGHQVNRKRVRRLLHLMGLEAIYRRPQHQQAIARAQGLSLPAQGASSQPGQSGADS